VGSQIRTGRPGLLPAADRIEVGPTDLSPQYSGQESELPAFLSPRFLVLGVELCALSRQARALRPRQLLGECGLNGLTPITELSPGNEFIDAIEQLSIERDRDLCLRHVTFPVR
jgi:hypothetical protein